MGEITDQSQETIIYLLEEILNLRPQEIILPVKRVEYATILLDYCTEHFWAEEREMFLDDFPGYEIHRFYHEDLQDSFRSILKELLQGDYEINQLVHLVRNKFLKHVLTLDEAYLEWKREQK